MYEVSDEKISHFPRFFMILSVPAILYVLLLGFAFLDIIAINIELHSIVIILLILLIFMLFIMHNAWYAFSAFRNNLKGVLEKVENYLTANQLTINGSTKSFGNIDEFFDEYTRSVRNDNFASVAASMFPTLGILGTFVAIAISMPDFSVESQDALESEITILLSGIGTAFYASIYGIFLSLWWTFFEKRGLTKIQNEIDEIKSFYKNQMWNDEEIKILSIIQSKRQNENMMDKLEKIITPEFVFTLDKIAEQKIETVSKMTEEYEVAQNRLKYNYENLTQLFMHTSEKQKDLLRDFENLHSVILKTNSGINDSIVEQNKHSKALKAEIYSVLSSFELLSNDLKTLGQDLIKKDIQVSKENK